MRCFKLCVISLLSFLTLTSCASLNQKYARSVAQEAFEHRFDRVGEVSEHVIDLTEGGFIFLQPNIENYWVQYGKNASHSQATALGTFVGGPAFGLLIGGMNLNMCKRLGPIWLEKNRMRKSLKKTYGDAFDKDLYDDEKVLYYQWYVDQESFKNPASSWVYIGPRLFGKENASEITEEDVGKFFDRINSSRFWSVKMKYNGSAKVPFPPLGWGNVNFFDVIDITPANDEMMAKKAN